MAGRLWPRCWSANRPKYVRRATSRSGDRIPTGRTSAHHADLLQPFGAEPLDVVRRTRDDDLAPPPSPAVRRPRRARMLLGFAQRLGQAASDTSCASVSTGPAFQTKRTSAASRRDRGLPGAVATRTMSPLRHAPEGANVGHEPDAAHDRVGGIERRRCRCRGTLARDDGDAKSVAAREMPSIACSSSHPNRRLLGVAEMRQSVSASGSLRRRRHSVRRRARRAHRHGRDHARREGGPWSDTASPRSEGGAQHGGVSRVVQHVPT